MQDTIQEVREPMRYALATQPVEITKLSIPFGNIMVVMLKAFIAFLIFAIPTSFVLAMIFGILAAIIGA